MERHKMIPAVYVLLIRDSRVLLMRRRNTGYMDGWYGLPSGHVEDGEKLEEAARREVWEETDVRIKPGDLKLIHVMRRYKPEEDRIDFFFETMVWKGQAKIGEPDKCDEIGWFDMEHLPENTITYVGDFIYYCYPAVRPFSELGWGKDRIPKKITKITWFD